MPVEIGGKKFAADIKSMMAAELDKAFADSRKIIQEAAAELGNVVRDQGRGVARKIREEAQHIRDELGEVTGNNPTEEELAAEAAERQAITASDVGNVIDVVGKLDPTAANPEEGKAA